MHQLPSFADHMGQIVQVKLTANPSESGSLRKIDFELLHCLLGVIDWQDKFHEVEDVDSFVKNFDGQLHFSISNFLHIKHEKISYMRLT